MTLTEAAYWTRKFGVIALGGVAFIILLIVIILNLPGRDPLPNYLTPTYACTQTKEDFLKHKLVIPTLQVAQGSENIYEIDTQTGKLDQLPLIANVYRYNNPGPTLSSQSEAKNIARKLGFDQSAIQRRGAIEYYWNEDLYGRKLAVDANTLNFKMTVNFNNPNALPPEKNLPTEAEAKSIATSLLRGQGWLLADYAKEEPLTTYINIEPDGTFSMARSRSEAELIRVDFYRSAAFLSVRGDIDGADQIKEGLDAEYNDYKTSTETIITENGKVDLYNFNAEIFHTNTQKSNISVYVGTKDTRRKGLNGQPEIYGVDYTAWILAAEPCGTYPLISATQVTTIIENGQASLVYLNENNGDTVVPYQPRKVSKFSVKQVRLAYLDLEEEREFLQPVYVVLGEATLESGTIGRFYYYIPAVDYENLQDPIVTTPTTEGKTTNNSGL